MRTIQIAPSASECRIEDHKVIGTMDGRTFIFEIPSRYSIPKNLHKVMISNFREAIALCSKPWQVEELLCLHWHITNGKFYELNDERLERVFVIQFNEGGRWKDLEETEYTEKEADIVLANWKAWEVGKVVRKKHIRTDIVQIVSAR